MSLSRTIDLAHSSLSVASERSAIAARNISHAGEDGATRKIVRLTTDSGNAPRIAGIVRLVPDALHGRVLAAQADAAKENVIAAALDQLQVIGDPQSDSTIGSQLGKFRSALATYASRPSDETVAAAALAKAVDVADTLQDGAAAIARVRLLADQDIGAAVKRVNVDLSEFAQLDRAVTQGVRAGRDVTDELDERDRLLSGLAEQLGLTLIQRPDQGLALYTNGGIPLYDGHVRSVELTNDPLSPGQPGRSLLIDGLQASGDGAMMKVSSGRIAGLIALRDELTVKYGSQLDEIARGLVTAFAESDQGAPATLPNASGLFRIAGSTAIPPDGIWVIGAAASLEINPRVLPASGGDLQRLRDGGIASNDPAYVYNSHNAPGYSDRILQLVDQFDTKLTVAPQSELSPAGSVLEIAASSSGWLQNLRQSSEQKTEFADAFLDRAKGSLDQVSGVNIDEQILELLDLQRSFQASSKLITTVDAMFDALFQAIR